ncbi:MAG: AbrB/MazE/SpoVT family DNA-binding domain-containing protein [Candidatus Binataceae bacterium]
MKVTKWGNSLAIRISAPLARQARIAEGTEVEITASSGRIVVAPSRREYRLEELVQAITPENRHAETEWGGPVGAETW